MRLLGWTSGLAALLLGGFALIVVLLAAAFSDTFPSPSFGLDLQGGLRLVCHVEVPEDFDRDVVVAQVRETLMRRAEELGFSEMSVRTDGERVTLELGGGVGTSELEYGDAIGLLVGEGGTLEFRAVDDETPYFEDDPPPPDGIEIRSESLGRLGEGRYLQANGLGAHERLAAFIDNLDAPEGREILIEESEGLEPGEPVARTYLVVREAPVTGDMVADASVFNDELTNVPVVMLTLDERGGAEMHRFSTEMMERRIAIVFDGEVSSAPRVASPIHDRVQITLGGGRPYDEVYQEAVELTVLLRAGSLPASLTLEEQHVILPTYGRGTRLALLAGPPVLLLLLTLGAAIRYLRQAPALVIAVLAAIGAGALASLSSVTITVTFVAGLWLALFVSFGCGLAVAERVRRLEGATMSWGIKTLLAGVLAPLLLALGGLLGYLLAVGPARGAAVGVLIGAASATVFGFLLSAGLVLTRKSTES